MGGTCHLPLRTCEVIIVGCREKVIVKPDAMRVTAGVRWHPHELPFIGLEKLV